MFWDNVIFIFSCMWASFHSLVNSNSVSIRKFRIELQILVCSGMVAYRFEWNKGRRQKI
jgi:hypothetical protein